MNTVAAPKINKKAIVKLNEALLLTGIVSRCRLAVRDDNTYTLHIESDRTLTPIRVRLCGEYLLDGLAHDIAMDILNEYEATIKILSYPKFKEAIYPAPKD